MATPVPGLPFPNALEQELQALQAAIANGVLEVRFQDRTIRYDSAQSLILRSNYLYQLLNPYSGIRTVRCYSNKGL